MPVSEKVLIPFSLSQNSGSICCVSVDTVYSIFRGNGKAEKLKRPLKEQHTKI